MNDDYKDDNDTRRPMTVEELRASYDWGAMFERREGAIAEASRSPDPLPGFTGAVAWTLGDVAEVIASDDGIADERDWVALLRLTDGRVLFMSAGCDYTGWDCQAGGRSIVGTDLETLKRLGMTDEERERLHVA